MKTLVAYFSISGHTKRVAEEVAKNLGADIFEIVPENPYTDADLDWTNPESRASKEFGDPALREMNLAVSDVPNWESYERVIIGYPIWWGVAAWPTNAFVKSQNFDGKIIVPFCTSHSSGFGESNASLIESTGTCDWQPGIRFFQDAPASEVKNWTDRL